MGTVPPDVLVTSERHDLVFLELTCSFEEQNIDSAYLRKSSKYTDLKTNLLEAGAQFCVHDLVCTI